MNAQSHRSDIDQLNPSWSVQVTSLAGEDEIFLHTSRRILIDPTRHDEAWMRAHVAAHLDLSHHVGCGTSFTAQEEHDADALAQGRIDLAEKCGLELFELPPIDGEPSVPFSRL